ncbi:hypothetical protein CkaCkLH20_04620 [Colletotrichum karsti]|uniref:NAD(P)-binding domain-containing protein n=1 Tax=Colletotrichum karsti TaxID=1095194 RepID=A0A9P6I873_9PEZI|nr:uncharacterized protein CkaCkLH20_04620 [Colletotrichum karsti]KAF9878044.1 hypothetical protein CkaCkLH20_04620 [Colletotrichum karsti]
MKVAVAGVGDVAKYLLEELPKEGHQVVAITRSRKDFLEVDQRITDYSVSNLLGHLQDCDAVICGITAAALEFTDSHLALLEACKQSPKCKRFIPSAWAGNYEDVPDQPLFAGNQLEAIREALQRQTDVSWTFVCQGWIADYLVPTAQRHFSDIGDLWVQNHETKVFTLYGSGSQKVDFTAGRDTARAVAVLLNHDSIDWEAYTCVSGQQMTWRELWEFVKSREPDYVVVKKSLAQSIKQLMANENEATATAAMYEIMGHSEALAFADGKVQRHREKYFKNLKFRTVAEVYDDAIQNRGVVV